MDELLTELAKNAAARYGIVAFISLSASGGLTWALKIPTQLLVGVIAYVFRNKHLPDLTQKVRDMIYNSILRLISVTVGGTFGGLVSAKMKVSITEGVAIGISCGIGASLVVLAWKKLARRAGFADSQDIEGSSNNLTLSIPAVERPTPVPAVTDPAEKKTSDLPK